MHQIRISKNAQQQLKEDYSNDILNYCKEHIPPCDFICYNALANNEDIYAKIYTVMINDHLYGVAPIKRDDDFIFVLFTSTEVPDAHVMGIMQAASFKRN